jgi:stress response protein YsnF
VAKEELRIRKDVVEDAVIVTKKVRCKEVDVDDQTTGRMS